VSAGVVVGSGPIYQQLFNYVERQLQRPISTLARAGDPRLRQVQATASTNSPGSPKWTYRIVSVANACRTTLAEGPQLRQA